MTDRITIEAGKRSASRVFAVCALLRGMYSGWLAGGMTVSRLSARALNGRQDTNRCAHGSPAISSHLIELATDN